MNPKVLLKWLKKSKPKNKGRVKSQLDEDLSTPSSPSLDFPSLFLIAASLSTTSAKCNS